MAHAVDLSLEHVPGPAAATRRALFLHGILGSGANLRGLARRFVKARPGWDAALVDLRGHGGSPKGAPGPSLPAAAADVLALGAGPPPIAAIIGHSFGGKVALEAARQGLAGGAGGGAPVLGSLAHVVTLDSNPGTREPPAQGDSAPAVVEMLAALPPTFPSAAAFTAAVIARGKSRSLAQWLAMSLAPGPGGGVRFALDLDEIRALMASYFAVDLWPFVEDPPGPLQVHLVIAERSSSYAPADRERAAAAADRCPHVTIDVLPTDYWVHAEDPEGTLRALLARVPG